MNSKKTDFYKYAVFVETVWCLTHLFALNIILEAEKKKESKTKLKKIVLTTESIFMIALTKLPGKAGLGH